MEKWKVMLCSGNSELGEIEIKQGRRFFIPFKFDFKKGEGSI